MYYVILREMRRGTSLLSRISIYKGGLPMKRLLAVLLAGLLFFAMSGMEAATRPTKAEIQEDVQEWFDDMIKLYEESDPERAAYYAKWKDIDIPSPYPAEWQNEDGTMKSFVTEEMLREAFTGSMLEQFYLEDPVMQRGWNQCVSIVLDEDGSVGYMVSVVVS